MKNYKVLKEGGVQTISGKSIKKGDTFQGSPRSAMIKLQLRCKEIEEVKEPAQSVSTVEDLKALLMDRGIEIPKDAKKADLEKLVAEPDPPQK